MSLQKTQVDEFIMKHHDNICLDKKIRAMNSVNQKQKTLENIKFPGDFSPKSAMPDKPSLLENWRGLTVRKS